MRKENQLESCYKKCCFPVLDTGSPALVVSDRWDNLRKKIGRCRIKCGKTLNLMGFTLIELLVVVLIIGILASVALPQYQKAVDKTRYMQVMLLVDAAIKAHKAYYLANGSFAASFDELDVELPAPQTKVGSRWFYRWGDCNFANGDRSAITCEINLETGLYYTVNALTGERACFARTTNQRGRRVCENITKKSGSVGDTYAWYVF